MSDLDFGGIVKKTKRHCNDMIITERKYPYVFHRINQTTLYEYYRSVDSMYKKFDTIITDYNDKIVAVSPQELYFSPFNCVPIEAYLPTTLTKEDIFVYEDGFNFHLIHDVVSDVDEEWCVCDEELNAGGWNVLPTTNSSMFLFNRLKYEITKLLTSDMTSLLDKRCCYTIRFQDPNFHPKCTESVITFVASYKIVDDTIVRGYPIENQTELYAFIQDPANTHFKTHKPIEWDESKAHCNMSLNEILSECFENHVQVVVLDRETQSQTILSKSMFMYINDESSLLVPNVSVSVVGALK